MLYLVVRVRMAVLPLQTIISNNRQIMLTIIVFSLGIVFLAGSEMLLYCIHLDVVCSCSTSTKPTPHSRTINV